jgi:hypothetical protein
MHKKPTIKVKYHNFWGNFNPNKMPQDYFFEFILSHGYNVIIDDYSPDLVVASSFGPIVERKNFKSNPFIINFNFEPDWIYPNRSVGEFDMMIGHGPGYYRVPLWMMYTIWNETNLNTTYRLKDDPYIGQGCHHTPGYGLSVDNGLENNPLFISNILNRHTKEYHKNKFCNFTYTKPVESRVICFNVLNEYKFVHSTGTVLNNTGYRMISKSKELSEYKFAIAFESGISPGYVTEKIFEPLVAGCVPIYFGDESCLTDFNDKAFVYANKFKTYAELREYIIELDNNDEMYYNYLKQPIFGKNEIEVLDRCKKLFDTIYTNLTDKLPHLKL